MDFSTDVIRENNFKDKLYMNSYLWARFKCPLNNFTDIFDSSSSLKSQCELNGYSFLLYWFITDQSSNIYVSNYTLESTLFTPLFRLITPLFSIFTPLLKKFITLV